MNKKGLYIRNIEGLDAYKLMKGEKNKLTNNWTGYIPYSLELLKLITEGVEIYQEKIVKVKNEKGKSVTKWIEVDGKKIPEIEYIMRKAELSDFNNGKNNRSLDIINVNFRCSYDNSDDIVQSKEYKELRDKRDRLNNLKKYKTKEITKEKNKIKRMEVVAEKNNDIADTSKLEKVKIRKENTRKRLEGYIINVKKQMEELKTKISTEDLRTYLYENGFCDENGTRFVLWKRSGSKSRQGKIMFISQRLSDVMLSWGRMYIDFPLDKNLDIVAIGAYSSLVSSQIEDYLIINPSNILIVDEIESKWTQDAKKVIKGTNGHLEVVEGEMELNSCATDGSSILDESFFEDGIDFKLLRAHMFKSCSFRCSIQLYYGDYCKANGIDYDTFIVKDIFGNEMLAKNVKLIITKSSLKAFKFSSFVEDGTDKSMYNYWKRIVEEDNNIFGVCKHNKKSKWIFDGLEYNQMSYQMINSLPLNKKSLLKLTKWERNYVVKLKSDIEVFKNYLSLKANNMNCNEAMVEMLNKNPQFEGVELFRKFRTKTINKYMDKLRGGKIKNIGDYCTMISNPISYLKQSVGAYNENDLELSGNQISTKLFSYDHDLICFRNPHTSQANVYIGNNIYNPEIDKYFNFGRNIVVVNSIKNPICQIMSGCDWDSDSCIIYDNSAGLVDIGKECYGRYKIIENGIPLSKDNKYILNNTNLATVDNVLSKSKFTIGRITNIAQLAMSMLWDKKNKGAKHEDLKDLQEIVDIMSILCGVSIDNAKKSYDVVIDEEIDYIVKKLNVDKKPLFWRYVSEDKRLSTKEGREEKLIRYETSMDILGEEALFVHKADDKENVELISLLRSEDLCKDDADRKQQNELIEKVKELDKFIGVKMENKTKENEEDAYREIDLKIEELEKSIAKKTIKANTIYALLLLIDEQGQEKKVAEVRDISSRLINTLYSKSKSTFLSVFK